MNSKSLVGAIKVLKENLKTRDVYLLFSHIFLQRRGRHSGPAEEKTSPFFKNFGGSPKKIFKIWRYP